VSEDVIVLPIEGLHRAPASAARVEYALAETWGVHRASINPTTEKVRVTFDPGQVDLRDLASAVRSAGADVRTSCVVIGVHTIACEACAARIGDALRHLAGVLHASVDLPTRRAIVSYLPAYLTVRDLTQVIRDSGYEPASREDEHRTRAAAAAR